MVRARESAEPQHWLAGPRRLCSRVEVGWAAQWIWPKCQFLNNKLFSFSKIYFINYKLI
jgi:hypothetical protein